MPFVGINPPIAKVNHDSGIASQVDSTAQVTAGHIAFFKDSSNRWSMLKYYEAGASILQGAALVQDTAARDPNQLITAATDHANVGNVCKGIAAAAVSNTGRYSWAYIAGYCPDAAMPTNYASNQFMKLSATYAGRLSSAIVNASNACTGGTLSQHVVAWSLGAAAVSTANSTNSVVLCGLLL